MGKRALKSSPIAITLAVKLSKLVTSNLWSEMHKFLPRQCFAPCAQHVGPGLVLAQEMALPRGQIPYQTFLHIYTASVNLEWHNIFPSWWSCLLCQRCPSYMLGCYHPSLPMMTNCEEPKSTPNAVRPVGSLQASAGCFPRADGDSPSCRSTKTARMLLAAVPHSSILEGMLLPAASQRAGDAVGTKECYPGRPKCSVNSG